MRKRPQLPEPFLIERQKQVDDLCEQCRHATRFAFDTEFVMEDRYESELCLIQVATHSAVWIVDPFLKLDLRPIWDLVCDPEIETMVHAGQEDLALCVQHTDRVPSNVFDVQIAAALVGPDYPISLQKLVRSVLHIRMHKAKTLTDWRRRPLTLEHIRYGAEDVCYLPLIREELGKRLQRSKRTKWAQEEFRRFEDISLYRRAEEDKLLRIKGAGALDGRQLAIVRELLEWREGIAKRRNRPARTALKDHLLVEIAKLELASYAQVRELRGLNLSDKDIRSLCQVVTKGLELPEDEWPTPRPRDIELPAETALIALATAVIRCYCHEQNLAYGLAATKKHIRDLVRLRTAQEPHKANSAELLKGWRGLSVGAILDDVLNGRRTIRVDNDGTERSLRISDPENVKED